MDRAEDAWADELVGTVIAGRYRVLGGAGAGGTGTVCVAHDTVLDRTVALKRLRDGHPASLIDEARIAARLVHRNIVAIYDVFNHAGCDYLASEFVDGVRLHEVVAAGATPPHEALRVLSEIADALAHAHAHAIVHGDLKAENVVLTREGIAKLLDFGLARRDQSHVPIVRGHTARISPPERRDGEAPSAAGDVFALGVLLYELIAGVSPFAGASADVAPRRPLREWSPTAPLELSRLADTMLDPSAALRPTAAEAASRFAALQNHFPAGKESVGGAALRRVAVLAICLPRDDAFRLDRQSHRERAGAIHRAVARLAATSGGELVSAIGTQLVVTFGHDAPSETACHQATRLALALGQLLGDWAESTRLAIDIGDVLVEATERASRMVGDVLDEALHLAKAAQPGAIHASSRAHARLVDRYSLLPRLLPVTQTLVDGGGEPAVLYEVVSDAVRRTAPASHVPFVGRRRELATIRGALVEVSGPRPHQVLITGEPGVGKSRLLREAVLRLGEPGDGRAIYWVVGHEETQHSPFAPLRRLLDALVDPVASGVVLEEAALEVARADRLEPSEVIAALDLARGSTDECARQRIASLFQRERQNAVADVIARTVAAVSVRRPILLVVDDAQWLDRSSLHTLDEIRSRTSPRLAVMIAARPTASARADRACVVSLPRLTRAEAQELVAALPETRASSQEARDALIDAGEGLPLVLEQLARLGVDRSTGSLREIATSLGDLVATTLDQLGDAVRRTLEIVAHVGDSTSIALLRRTVGPSIEVHLSALVQLGLLRWGDGDDVGFSHLLVRDEVVRRTTETRRIAAHEAILAALSTEPADPAVLAQHSEGARQIADAVGHWLSAATAAKAIGAHETALSQNDRALSLVAANTNRVDAADLELAVRRSRTAILAQHFGWADGAVADNVRRVATQVNIATDLPAAHIAWMMSYAAGLLPATIEGLGALDVLTTRTAPRSLTRYVAACARGMTYIHLGRLPQAAALLEEAAEWRDELAEDLARFGAVELVTAPEMYAAWAYALVGDAARARAAFETAATLQGHGSVAPMAARSMGMVLTHGLADPDAAYANALLVLETPALALPHRATARVVVAMYKLRHLTDPTLAEINRLVSEAWTGLAPYRWDNADPSRARMRAGYIVTLVEGADSCLALATSVCASNDVRRKALEHAAAFVEAGLHEVVDEDPAIHRYYASEAFRVAAVLSRVQGDRGRASVLLEEGRHRAHQIDCGDAGGAWLLLDRIVNEQQRLAGAA